MATQVSQTEFKQVDKFIVSNQVLGRGQFGTVSKGYFQNNLSKTVAVKQIRLDQASKDKKFIQLLKREIEILQKVKSDYVVKLYHATRTANNLYMFLEFCDEGDLKEMLKKKGGMLTESEAVQYFRQIVEGFKNLYDHNIIHRDIKPANIMIKEGRALISDFGFAKCLDQCGMEEQTKLTYLGTPLYMSPQILQEQNFSSKCDIWSLGMLFYEILYSRTPWTAKTQYKLLQNIKEQPLQFPDHPQTSDLVKDMLRKMLVFDENERLSWPELIQHDLIKLDYQDIQQQIDQLNNNNEDALLRSVEVNKFYCNKNKVMGADKRQNLKAFNNNLASKVSDNQDSKVSLGERDSQLQVDVNQENIQKVINEQVNQKQLKVQILDIDSFLTFNRNVGIFINLTTNYIFRLYQNKVFQVPDHQFFRIIFVMQKKQLIGFNHLISIMSGQAAHSFDQSVFQKYSESRQFQETLQLINQDIGYVKPYFLEIFGRAKSYLQTYQNMPEIQQFFEILNENLSDNDTKFDQIYNDVLQQFILSLKQQVPLVQNSRRDLLQTIAYVQLAKDSGSNFKWSQDAESDFHKFYARYDSLTEQELEQEIEKISQ